MAGRNVGRPWNSHEDFLLTQAVALHGENDNWKTIARSVPGRTNKACRKRWLHSLSPSIKKSAWTPDEDRILLDAHHAYPNKWSVIARHIPGRTDDACSKRYREALDPSLKKDEWTADEEDKLMEAYSKLGGKWGQIGQDLNRSGLACRNRWRQIQRRRAAEDSVEHQDQPIPSQSSSPYEVPCLQSAQWSPISMLDATPYWEGQMSPYIGNSPVVLPGHLTPTQEDILLSHMGSPSLCQDPPALPSHTEIPPPFQFSSSSLMAALTDPRIPKSLPSTNSNNGSEISTRPAGVPYDPPPISPETSASESRQDVVFNDDTDVSIPMDTCEIEEEPNPPRHNVALSESTSQSHQDTGTFRGHIEPTERSHSAPANSLDYPLSPGCSHDSDLSTSPTPISFAPVTLSPASSPNLANPLALPPSGSSFPASVLFTPYYSSVEQSRPMVITTKRRPDSHGPLRLSSNLVVTSDPSVLPYACGHEKCWPSDESTSHACYATSRELSDHSKLEHDTKPGGNRPFRCALTGCGKSWKSVNGLQYHLQISKAHFQQAISSTFSPVSYTGRLAPESASQATGSESKRKTWHCPHPNCIKEYRQLSGLRYHLTHGHPEDLPVQLEVVPPALARKVAEKMGVRATGLT